MYSHFRLIRKGTGIEVVQHLLYISRSGRTLRQNYLIFALAICARSNSPSTREKAYRNLNCICRTSTHFFSFVNYCKQESLLSKSTGWGRMHRKAMLNWYEEKKTNPIGLGRHLTKCKGRKMKTNDGKRKVWSHKKVLKMAHPKFKDSLMKVVTKYVFFGLNEAQSFASSMEKNDKSISDFLSYIEGTEKAKRCHDENELSTLIKSFRLDREQIPTQMMESKKVCEAIMENMKTEARIRNICLMASKGLCDKESKCERFIAESLSNEALQAAKVHPARILVALLSYKKGEKKAPRKSSDKTVKWSVNENICQTLESAFYRSFQLVEESKEKRFLLAISINKDMSEPCQGCPSINCKEAAAAMMMLTVKTEGKCTIVGFSDDVVREIDIKRKNTLEEVMQEIGQYVDSGTDPCLPIRWATQKKKKFDVFIVYFDKITTERQNVSEEMEKYREKMEIPDARMIVVAMRASQPILANQKDPFILNIVGFDSTVVRIIQKFARKEI